MNPTTTTPGSILVGKLRVERVLGQGGMGTVFEATHLVLGQRVAVKVLQGNPRETPELLDRFRREARIAGRLDGEHVARAMDAGLLDDGRPYLVMELRVGHDYEVELQRRGQLPVTDAVDDLLQACEGVAEAHAAGLVHRDLKPANLFITRRRDASRLIKVLDFGISKAMVKGRRPPAITPEASRFGTPAYMSPEQLTAADEVDARSDQHALATILYEMLAGRTPHADVNLAALAVSIATRPVTPLRELRPDAPLGLEAALMRALSKRPDDRHLDLAAFAWAIAPYGGPGACAAAERVEEALGAPRAVFDDDDDALDGVADLERLLAEADIAPPPVPLAGPPTLRDVTIATAGSSFASDPPPPSSRAHGRLRPRGARAFGLAAAGVVAAVALVGSFLDVEALADTRASRGVAAHAAIAAGRVATVATDPAPRAIAVEPGEPAALVQPGEGPAKDVAEPEVAPAPAGTGASKPAEKASRAGGAARGAARRPARPEAAPLPTPGAEPVDRSPASAREVFDAR